MKMKNTNTDHIRAAIDLEGRCKHYYGEYDTISIKFKCCKKYYPCYKCHEDHEDHQIQLWDPKDFNRKAILCGVCKQELSINYYLHHNHCNNCQAVFNQNCSRHYHKYFNIVNGNRSGNCI